MPKFYYKEALSIMFKTLPCVMANFAAHMAFGAALLLYYAALFGIAWLTKDVPLLPVVIVIGGLGASKWWYDLAKHYVLYLLKAGHIAVMSEIIANGKIPDGQSQIEWGKRQVLERFKDISIFSGVDLLVRGVVKTITQMVGGILNVLPVPEIGNVTKALKVITLKATDYVDEAILARAFLTKEKNVWQVAQDGAVLYGMSWKPILLNAAGLAVISWASFPIFLIAFTPVGLGLAAVLPDSMGLFAGVAVLALAYLAKASLGDTFALATTIVAFQRETANLQPDQAWNDKLAAASEKFRDLKKKASEFTAESFDKLKAKAHVPPAPAPTVPDTGAASVGVATPG